MKKPVISIPCQQPRPRHAEAIYKYLDRMQVEKEGCFQALRDHCKAVNLIFPLLVQRVAASTLGAGLPWTRAVQVGTSNMGKGRGGRDPWPASSGLLTTKEGESKGEVWYGCEKGVSSKWLLVV